MSHKNLKYYHCLFELSEWCMCSSLVIVLYLEVILAQPCGFSQSTGVDWYSLKDSRGPYADFGVLSLHLPPFIYSAPHSCLGLSKFISLTPQLRKIARLCLHFTSLLWSPESSSKQKALLMVMLSSFVFTFSGRTVLHCLLYNIWK